MSKLIIVCGLPGSGKSTLARELSRQLNIACLHKDDLKENLFEILALETPEDAKRIGIASVKLLLALAEGQLRNKIDLIIEAPFNFSEDYSVFSNWVQSYETDIFSVICKIPSEVRKERFLNRPRHQAHFDTEASYDAFFSGSDREIVYDQMPGKKLELITDQAPRLLVNRIIDFINKS